MTRIKQDPPFCIKIEFSRGCNLQCDFCGINSIQTRPSENIQFMSRDTAESVVGNIPEHWNPRFELTLRGEPSLNPDGPYIISLIRKRFPKASIMMTSNGGGFVGKNGFNRMMEMFNSGLNMLALDDYEHANLIPKIRKYIVDLELEGVKVYEYPEQPEGHPHKRRTGKSVSFLQDLTVATKGSHTSPNNHAGAAAPLDSRYDDVRCALPFRDMVVRYDGTVNLCCNIWTGDYTFGDATLDSLEDLWNCAELEAIRKVLYHEGRKYAPCLGCTAKPVRVGLLPDKLGKQEMPPVTEKDRAIIRETAYKGREKTIVGRALENIPVIQITEDDL